MTADQPTGSIYVTRIQQTRMPGYNHVWFRCSGCDLQGDMTGTNDETDEVLAVLSAAHDARHSGASTVPDHLPDNDESRGHGSVR